MSAFTFPGTPLSSGDRRAVAEHGGKVDVGMRRETLSALGELADVTGGAGDGGAETTGGQPRAREVCLPWHAVYPDQNWPQERVAAVPGGATLGGTAARGLPGPYTPCSGMARGPR